MDFSSDDDLHICGKCKQGFSRLDDWLHHKRAKACMDRRPGRPLKSDQDRGSAVAPSSPLKVPRESAEQDEEDEENNEADNEDEDTVPSRVDEGTERHGDVAKVNGSIHNGGMEDEDDEDDDEDEVCSTNGDSEGPAADASQTNATDRGRSIITRNLFPIAPCIRKRERPGPVDAGCSSPGSAGYSPTTECPGSVKRKRGYPQRLDTVGPATAVAQPLTAEACSLDMLSQPVLGPPLPEGTHIANNGSGSSADGASACGLLPPVYKCERCRKGFMKFSHLQRHMKKKKPCKPRTETYGGEGKMDLACSSRLLSAAKMAATQAVAEPDASLPPTYHNTPAEHTSAGGSFCCSVCKAECGTYDGIMGHHIAQHVLYYPGYCRFCGTYFDKKNKLQMHLATHTSPDIVEDVAMEMKRIRQTKIERHSLAVTQSAAPSSLTCSSNSKLPTLAEVSLTCAVCSIVCNKEGDMLSHHNSCHTPVGLYATLADLRRGKVDSDGSVGGTLAHNKWKNCFICCLKFTEGSEFEDHIVYHRMWTTLQGANGEPDSSAVREGSSAGVIGRPHLKAEVPCGPHHADSSNGDSSANGTRNDKGALQENGSVSNQGLAFICWVCTRQFSQYEAWRRHLLGDHGLRPVYQCMHDLCRRSFEAWHELAAHSHEHAQRAFVCAVCNHHSATYETLLTHAKLHQTLGLPWYYSLPPQGQRADAAGSARAFACSHCEERLPDELQLSSHMEHCRRQYAACVDCGDEVHHSKLAQHVAAAHGGQASDGSAGEAKPFGCDLCSSAFPVRERLTQHMKNVHGPRKYVCQVCGAAFKRSDKLKRHFSLHSDDRPYVCPHPSCGRGFKRADGLRAHARYHEQAPSGSAPYVCSHCDAAFDCQQSFMLHLCADNVAALEGGRGSDCDAGGHLPSGARQSRQVL